MQTQQDAAVEFVERIRRHVVDELTRIYGPFDLPQLAQMAEGVEELVKFELLQVLVEESEMLFRCRNASTDNCIIDNENVEYHVRLGEDIRSTRSLLVSVTAIPEVPRPKIQKIAPAKCAETGRFRRVRFYVSATCPCATDLLQTTASTILDTAYSWFRARTEELVSSRADLLARGLYGYLRTMIPNDDARANVWFASVTTDFGFRLLAPDVTRASFAIIAAHADKFGYSTNRLVSEVLTTVLPRAKLLMQQAVRDKKCIDANLKDAKYAKEGSIYAFALMALYGSESFSVYPVTMDDKMSVLLLFPTPQRCELEPIIASHLPQLQKRCEEALSPIQRTLKTLRERKESMQLGPLGELIGGVAKGLFG